MAYYPCSLWSPTTKTNKVDLVDASHINTAQNEVVAMQAQLQKAFDSDGTILSGSSFPSPSAGPSQLFYRTDLNTLYIRNAANNAWATVAAASNVQIFTSSGTFTAPTGITKVYLSMVGGGGGGYGSNTGGGGCGGNWILNYPFTVTPGNNYTVTIGAGGLGRIEGSRSATDGGSTSFDTVSVSGGKASSGSGATTQTGGGLNASTSTPGYFQQLGGNGGASPGAGGGTPFGAGATPVTGGSPSVGNSGAANTGAGGGAGVSTGAAQGGDGGSGLCIVMY